MPTGSGRNSSEIAGVWEDDYGALRAEASLRFPIQVEGMVEESVNHQEVVRERNSLGQVDLVRGRLNRDVVVCSLPCKALEVHRNLELYSDGIVLRGGKRRRVNACWHHVDRILGRL